MLIFSHTITPRLDYIFGYILSEITDIPFSITSNEQEYIQFAGAKINYSGTPFNSSEIWIKPADLLFETNIKEQAISCSHTGKFKAFYFTGGDFDFDVFAASFYLLTRYEEYLPHQKDSYGRFAHENSLAFKEGFLQQPLVNTWITELRSMIANRFPQLPLRQRRFIFFPTYDIDMAWSYKNKGLLRNTGGFVKDLLKGRLYRLGERLAVLTGIKKDPYESYNWLHAFHQKNKLQPVYFFLVARKKNQYDKNISGNHSSMHALIKNHAEQYLVGIHPSWQTDNADILKIEKDKLEEIIGQKVIYSRQHFIRFHLPGTYRQLIDSGILHDFSMGYGSINGFRASVTTPFLWFDLERERQTDLLLHPFCFMDANAYYEQKLLPLQALEELRAYTNQVKQAGGTMITVWHNNFVGTDPLFAGWRDIYQQWVTEIKE